MWMAFRWPAGEVHHVSEEMRAVKGNVLTYCLLRMSVYSKAYHASLCG